MTGSAYLRGASSRMNMSSAAEFKARRIFFAAASEFRSKIQDAAALSPCMATELLRYLSIVDEHKPTQTQWDKAMGMELDTPSAQVIALEDHALGCGSIK